MKSFKQIALGAILAVSSVGAITYTSCSKDECKDVVCQNGGVCSGGNCTCAVGYEGSKCETMVRAKFIKTWTASDKRVSDNAAVPTYNAPIVAGATIMDVKIGKFWNVYVNDVMATVSGNTITIPSQDPDADSFYVSGSGVYDSVSKKINWSYTIKDPTNVSKSYTGVWQ